MPLQRTSLPKRIGTRNAEASLDSVKFGSAAAKELARNSGLTASDFEKLKASGKSGFTMGDVRGIVGPAA